MPLPLPSSDSGDAERPSTLPAPPPPGPGLPAPPAGQDVCYRHPDRAAGRRCTRCGKPACAECLHQVSVGSNCTDCVKAARPDIKTRARYWQASKPAIVTYTLIGINVAVFVIFGLVYGVGDMLSRSGGEAHLRYALFNELQFRNGSSIRLGDTGEWYRLLTSGFLHYGLIHLAFNMYILFMIGNQMEPQVGRVRFIMMYFASLLGGSAGVMLLDSGGLSAGASGAVFGLLGAMAIGMWLHGINPFSTGVGRLLLINIGFTFLFSSTISVGGHLGGLVAGALCALVVMAPAFKGYPKWATYATPAVVGAVAVAVSFVAGS